MINLSKYSSCSTTLLSPWYVAFLPAAVLAFSLLGGCVSKDKKQDIVKDYSDSPVEESWLINVLPENWEVRVTGRGKESALLEATPKMQTSEPWQDLITSQTYYKINATPDKFFKIWASLLEEQCEGFVAQPFVPSEKINGYHVLYWQQFCPQTPEDNSQEFSLVKAASDGEVLYLLKRSWKYIPGQPQMIKAMQWLNVATVVNAETIDQPGIMHFKKQ